MYKKIPDREEEEFSRAMEVEVSTPLLPKYRILAGVDIITQSQLDLEIFQAVLSSFPMFTVKLMSFHTTLGTGSKYFWVWGSTAPVWKRSRALSRKGTPCLFLGKMWSLEKWWKTELYSLNSSIWGTVKAHWCCVHLSLILWTVCPSYIHKYSENSHELENGILPPWYLSGFHVLHHVVIQNLGDVACHLKKVCNGSLLCNSLTFIASSF